jgi:ribonuclease T1
VFRKWGLAVTLGSAIGVGTLGLQARTSEPTAQESAALSTVALSSLPVQAQESHRLVLQGGPFPYSKDGTVFFNRERLLPGQARGYYREYTVPTPGSRDRGARRLVCGGERPIEPQACYYTADHYASFRRITQ